MAHAEARETKMQKLTSNVIHPMSPVRMKSLITGDIRKDVCTWRDPHLGLTLFQIAVIADNVSAGDSHVPLTQL